MAEGPQWERPLRILSLDGGGVRGLSCLMMLRNIMNHIADEERVENPDNLRPADYFDLICGTSTGGLIAILLGRMRLTIKQAIELYRDLARRIFDQERGRSVGGVRFSWGGEERYDAEVLKVEIQNVVRQKLGDAQARMYEPPNADGSWNCRTFVLAVIADVANSEAHLFTTYERNDHTTIWEACRATSAATGFFEPMMIGDPPVRYVDAGLGFNNPGEQAYHEAKYRWPQRDIGVFLSLGTGQETEASLPQSGGWFGLRNQTATVKVLIQLTTSARKAHGNLVRTLRRDQITEYYRFNVDRGLNKIGLDEWNREVELAGYTTAYFNDPETADKKERCGTRLRQLTGRAKPFVLPADDFVATHENDSRDEGPGKPNMLRWYREPVGHSGYPDSVTVDSRFKDANIRPHSQTILTLYRVSNLQLRAQANNIPHGRYRVRWIIWLWAGETFPPSGGEISPVAKFTNNSVLERIFQPKDRTRQNMQDDGRFWFPFDTRFSVGRAKRRGDAFMRDSVDVTQHPLVAEELLLPDYKQYTLEAGLWNTYKNVGWCEVGDDYVDVDLDGHLAFVVSNWWSYGYVRTFGGFSFAGVRLEPVPF